MGTIKSAWGYDVLAEDEPSILEVVDYSYTCTYSENAQNKVIVDCVFDEGGPLVEVWVSDIKKWKGLLDVRYYEDPDVANPHLEDFKFISHLTPPIDEEKLGYEINDVITDLVF